jgi:aspartyl-tRNA(Asn)/glutamyl-tRNA(Gln) amidotransferase subunit A
MNELLGLSAHQLASMIRGREVSPVEAVQAVLGQIEKFDPLVRAMVTVDAAGAIESARRAEKEAQRTDALGPLHGVPITVKDLIATQGMRTTMGSAVLQDRIPEVDAPAITLLREAGAIIVGKTSTSEFGHKAVTDGMLGEPTANPWDLARTAGGSSGGAGAALALGFGPVAIATDGGGSIRIPAAFCGVFGIKPTTGTVPTYPPSLIGPLGHTGPMARHLVDVALTLGVMQGVPHVNQLPAVIEAADDAGLRDLRIGVFHTANDLPVEPDILQAVDRAARVAELCGARVEPITLDVGGFEEIWDALFDRGMLSQVGQVHDDGETLFTPSFAEVLARARSRRIGEAEQADARRIQMVQKVNSLFDDYDVLLGPPASVTAFPLGIDGPASIAGRSVDERVWWRLAQLWNLCGHPACVIPYGVNHAGLPVGVQMVGRMGHDQALLRNAAVVAAHVDMPRPSAVEVA